MPTPRTDDRVSPALSGLEPDQPNFWRRVVETSMGAPYHHEPLIPASRGTAAANLAILRTAAADDGQSLTVGEANAAILMASEFGKLINE